MKRTKYGKQAVAEVNKDVNVHLEHLIYDLSITHENVCTEHVNVNVHTTEDGADSGLIVTFAYDTYDRIAFSAPRIEVNLDAAWLDWSAVRMEIVKVLLCELSAIPYSDVQVTHTPFTLATALESLAIPRMIHDMRVSVVKLASLEDVRELTPFAACYDDTTFGTVTFRETVYAACERDARRKFVEVLAHDYRLDTWLTQGARLVAVESKLEYVTLDYSSNTVCVEEA